MKRIIIGWFIGCLLLSLPMVLIIRKQGRDSQNILGKILKIFLTVSLKMSSLLEV
jgi:hypothetical protein